VRRRGARRRGRAGLARPPAAQCGADSGGGGRAGSRAAAVGPSAVAGGAGVWQERVATAMGGPWRPSGVEYFIGCMRRAQPKSGWEHVTALQPYSCTRRRRNGKEERSKAK
jgi:hypothetical protein